jgi:hypothetical protein
MVEDRSRWRAVEVRFRETERPCRQNFEAGVVGRVEEVDGVIGLVFLIGFGQKTRIAARSAINTASPSITTGS